jgi:hypothetical protein
MTVAYATQYGRHIASQRAEVELTMELLKSGGTANVRGLSMNSIDGNEV